MFLLYRPIGKGVVVFSLKLDFSIIIFRGSPDDGIQVDKCRHFTNVVPVNVYRSRLSVGLPGRAAEQRVSAGMSSFVGLLLVTQSNVPI